MVDRKPLADVLGATGTSSLQPEMIHVQMDRIMSSAAFKATKAQRSFFRFVVDKTLAGQSAEIKGYTVATQVFGRRKDFDQATDPIVSIQANKLRRALETYYLGAGRQDPVRIDIPKGAYVPQFTDCRFTEAADAVTDPAKADVAASGAWPSVLVRPFENISGNSQLDHWGIGLAAELAIELDQYPTIHVWTEGAIHPGTHANGAVARFEMGGKVRCDEDCLKVTVHLTDTRTGRQIWGDSRRCSMNPATLIAFQEEIARKVAAKTAGEQGWIARTIASEQKRTAPGEIKTHDAILRFYEHDKKLTPESFQMAMEALEYAVANDPTCGQAWCMLAILYADLYVLDIQGYEKPLEKAFKFAATGIRLGPFNRRCKVVMAYVHFLCDEIAAARSEAEQALTLGRNSFFLLDWIGYLMTLLGDWERGPALLRKVIRVNPGYNMIVHYALWVNCLRQKDYAGAYQETLKLNRPELFWDHLAKAATLGLLGNTEKGRKAAAELLNLKPDFNESGRKLIRYFIKFDEIVDRVIDGLSRVGIDVA